MKQQILIVGAGGHGRSVAESVQAGGVYEVAGFLDDAYPNTTSVWEYPVLGTTADLAVIAPRFGAAIVAIGNNRVREELHGRLAQEGIVLATVIHPKAIVSPRAVVGHGTAIMAGAVVGTEAFLGEGVIVNCGATVDHHCKVGDYSHLGVNACMAGGSILERGAWMQACAALGYSVKLEAYAVLQPGQAVSVGSN